MILIENSIRLECRQLIWKRSSESSWWFTCSDFLIEKNFMLKRIFKLNLYDLILNSIILWFSSQIYLLICSVCEMGHLEYHTHTHPNYCDLCETEIPFTNAHTLWSDLFLNWKFSDDTIQFDCILYKWFFSFI